jgi:hypothetical protein
MSGTSKDNDGVAVLITFSPRKTKKLRAVFFYEGKYWKSVDFGQRPYEDFTTHKDERRKERYLKRHQEKEDWEDFTSPGALARWILWNKPTLKASYNDYINRFGLERYGQGISVENL